MYVAGLNSRRDNVEMAGFFLLMLSYNMLANGLGA